MQFGGGQVTGTVVVVDGHGVGKVRGHNNSRDFVVAVTLLLHSQLSSLRVSRSISPNAAEAASSKNPAAATMNKTK
jgi:hypothetical protein